MFLFCFNEQVVDRATPPTILTINHPIRLTVMVAVEGAGEATQEVEEEEEEEVT